MRESIPIKHASDFRIRKLKHLKKKKTMNTREVCIGISQKATLIWADESPKSLESNKKENANLFSHQSSTLATLVSDPSLSLSLSLCNPKLLSLPFSTQVNSSIFVIFSFVRLICEFFGVIHSLVRFTCSSYLFDLN